MMEYFFFKSILMTMLLIGAFGFFFVKLTRLYKIMLAVDGEPKCLVDKPVERIKTIFVDVLGHTNIIRKPVPGFAHALIFFGFLVIFPHSLELMIKGAIPAFSAGHLLPGFYTIYLSVADVLGVFVLAGLAYTLYRRVIIKPSYLTMGIDAKLIILFTSTIVISFYFVNIFQLLSHEMNDGINYGMAFPVSGFLAAVFGLGALSDKEVFVWYEAFYYIHLGTILGFLLYIPSSKHLHLLAAAPNVFFKRLGVEKAVVKTPLEDEKIETFGLANISELNWHNVLNLYACTECGRCEELCPAAGTGKPLSPQKIIHDLKVELFNQSDLLLAGEHNAIKPIIREGSQVTGDVLWACTTCRACENICPVSNEHLDFIFELRKNQVLMEANFPPELQEPFENIENQSNPWGFSADSRAQWCTDIEVPLMSEKLKVDILWFVGCAGSFDERGKKVSRATARILQKAGVDFAILGNEERCNGDMARRAGNEYLAQTMIMQNIEIFNRYSFDTILTGCPHCYNIIKNEFPDFGGHYNVLHTAEFFNLLLKEGRLKTNTPDCGSITLHDSCYLGRWNDIYESPRKVLKMATGSNLIEMSKTQSKSFCCGAGGARMFMEEHIGKRINNERASQIIHSGATTVVTSCPFCATMLGDGIIEGKGQVLVRDISEILDEATNF